MIWSCWKYLLHPNRGTPDWAALTLKTLGDAGVTGLGEVISMVRICGILAFVVGELCARIRCSTMKLSDVGTPVIISAF
jgi:hypothetical protein